MSLLLLSSCEVESWKDSAPPPECYDYSRDPVGIEDDAGLGFTAAEVIDALGYTWTYALSWEAGADVTPQSLTIEVGPVLSAYTVDALGYACVDTHPPQAEDGRDGREGWWFLELQADAVISTSGGEVHEQPAVLQVDAEAADPGLVWITLEAGAEGWSEGTLAKFEEAFAGNEGGECRPGTEVEGKVRHPAVNLTAACPWGGSGGRDRHEVWVSARGSLAEATR